MTGTGGAKGGSFQPNPMGKCIRAGAGLFIKGKQEYTRKEEKRKCIS
jgi:hypothetical protein